MARRTIDLVKAVEHEIRGEKAFSLGRVGARLEERLRELAGLAEAAAVATSDEREELVAAHAACRQRALDDYYALQLQREAIGVKHHDELAAMYPIPPALK
jgi:hypothetical protein